MKKLTLAFLISFGVWSEEEYRLQNWRASEIFSPAISKRCQILVEEREKKKTYKQKLRSLLQENLRLQDETPLRKVSIKKKLELGQSRIEREVELAEMRLLNMEESLIRRGCPSNWR